MNNNLDSATFDKDEPAMDDVGAAEGGEPLFVPPPAHEELPVPGVRYLAAEKEAHELQIDDKKKSRGLGSEGNACESSSEDTTDEW